MLNLGTLLHVSNIVVSVIIFSLLVAIPLCPSRWFPRFVMSLALKFRCLAFFEGPTIENLLANLIRKDSNHGQTSHLVPIQPRGEQRPLFMVHAISGGTYPLSAFVASSSASRPSTASAISAEDIKGKHCSSIEERAAVYIEEMKAAPVGRAVSFEVAGAVRGLVAYGIAPQLVEQGEQVALLALLDIQLLNNPDETNAETDAELLITIARDSMQQAEKNVFDINFEEIRHLSRDEQIQCVLDSMVRFELLPPEVKVAQALEFPQGQRRRHQSLRQYTVKPYRQRSL